MDQDSGHDSLSAGKASAPLPVPDPMSGEMLSPGFLFLRSLVQIHRSGLPKTFEKTSFVLIFSGQITLGCPS